MAMTAPAMAIDALVFDAYGTLFDVHAVIVRAEELAPGHGAVLSRLWRAKQLEYTWLQSLMGAREDFAAVTAHALDYALAELGVPLAQGERRELRDAYLTLAPFPDVSAALAALAPRPRWILSNGTLGMLTPLVRHARPRRAPGRRALRRRRRASTSQARGSTSWRSDRLALPAARIGFVSSNCWDAIGAKAFGFASFWINRAGAPVDRHGPAARSDHRHAVRPAAAAVRA